jgi:hypothetical protein
MPAGRSLPRRAGPEWARHFVDNIDDNISQWAADGNKKGLPRGTVPDLRLVPKTK